MLVGDREIAELKNAEILVADSDLMAQVMFELPKIKSIQTTKARVEKVYQVTREHGSPPNCLIIRYSRDSFGQIMAEYVIVQIINRQRNYFNHHENTKLKKVWIKTAKWDYHSLNEMTICILGGCGAIGSKIARMLSNLGAKALAFGRSERDEAQLEVLSISR